jgi:hypothetical protein
MAVLYFEVHLLCIDTDPEQHRCSRRNESPSISKDRKDSKYDKTENL